jgi:hypothetical protein
MQLSTPTLELSDAEAKGHERRRVVRVHHVVGVDGLDIGCHIPHPISHKLARLQPTVSLVQIRCVGLILRTPHLLGSWMQLMKCRSVLW